MAAVAASQLDGLIAERARVRSSAGLDLFEREAERVARCCHALAERFARGGTLLALASAPRALSDARHVAVEFVHPVIVGKRALPALAITPAQGGLEQRVRMLAGPDDAAIAFGAGDAGGGDAEAEAGLAAADRAGCLTIALGAAEAEWSFDSGVEDPFVSQELGETLYHVLWELVHVFFEHRGLLRGREPGAVHDAGASSFLYPFLSESERELGPVLDDVRGSVLMKSVEVAELRERTLRENGDELIAAARTLRRSFDEGGKLLAFGNGGSETDATDLVADCQLPPPAPADRGRRAGWPARPALDLGEDPAILTAIANDVGVEEVFQRQLIAYAREDDAVLALSTSGGSANLVAALREARRRGLATIALVGHDGGRIAAEGLADHVIHTRSEHIPRIQEAQASAYHVLRELVELCEAPE